MKDKDDYLLMMKTSQIREIFPKIVERYGSGKKIDIDLSFLHQRFKKGFKDVKRSGIYFDKYGNWRLLVNMIASLKVEVKPDVWEIVRDIYMSFPLKIKILTSGDVNEKALGILPKNLEVTKIKVIDNDDKQIEIEEMIIETLVNS